MADMTDRIPLEALEAMERRQQIMRAALERFNRLRFTEADADFWAAVREATRAAGATDRDIDVMATQLACFVVRCTEPGSELRAEQFDLIAEHFACADMTMRIEKAADRVVLVEFPGRATVH